MTYAMLNTYLQIEPRIEKLSQDLERLYAKSENCTSSIGTNNDIRGGGTVSDKVGAQIADIIKKKSQIQALADEKTQIEKYIDELSLTDPQMATILEYNILQGLKPWQIAVILKEYDSFAPSASTISRRLRKCFADY